MLQLSRRAAAPVAALAMLGAAGAQALAASQPIHGATYSGKITRVLHSGGKTFKSPFPISFAVSANGKRVSGFTLPSSYPIYCQGGGFGPAQSRSGKISKDGKFKVKLPLVFTPTHQHQGFLVVSGTFGKHRKVSGKVFTDFTTAKVCNGTAKYTAKAG